MKTFFAAALTVALSTAWGGVADAQTSAPSDDATGAVANGWSFAPSMTYAGTWDDNVLVKGKGDSLVGDYENVINPAGGVVYHGRRNQFSADYSGAFVLYHDLNTLNSYDQRASSRISRRLTPHITAFANGSLAISPTTELVDLLGVPFVRNGSRILDSHGGVDVQLSKRLSASATAGLSWVSFKQNLSQDFLLQGGHSVGGTASVREVLDARTTLTGDYDLQFATVGATAGGLATFTIQNAWAGADRRISSSIHAFAALGVSRMGATTESDARTGPAWRAGFSDQMRRAGVDVAYSRSYVPSFSFGGTQQNQDLTGRLRLSLSRRVYSAASVSWQSNEPLIQGELSLKSLWLDLHIGYELRPWMRLEAFFDDTHQTIDQPGGVLDRHRVGFQVITAKPMRIR